MLLGWDPRLAVPSANTEACHTFWQQWSRISSFSSRSALDHSRACVGFSYCSEKGKKHMAESGPTSSSLPWYLQTQRASFVLTIVNYIVTNYDFFSYIFKDLRCLQHRLEKKSGTILPGFYFYDLKHPDLLWRWLECNLASCGLFLKCFPCPLNAWYVRRVSSFSADWKTNWAFAVQSCFVHQRNLLPTFSKRVHVIIPCCGGRAGFQEVAALRKSFSDDNTSVNWIPSF